MSPSVWIFRLTSEFVFYLSFSFQIHAINMVIVLLLLLDDWISTTTLETDGSRRRRIPMVFLGHAKAAKWLLAFFTVTHAIRTCRALAKGTTMTVVIVGRRRRGFGFGWYSRCFQQRSLFLARKVVEQGVSRHDAGFFLDVARGIQCLTDNTNTDVVVVVG